MAFLSISIVSNQYEFETDIDDHQESSNHWEYTLLVKVVSGLLLVTLTINANIIYNV